MAEENIAKCTNCGHAIVKLAHGWFHATQKGQNIDLEHNKYGQVSTDCKDDGCTCNNPSI